MLTFGFSKPWNDPTLLPCALLHFFRAFAHFCAHFFSLQNPCPRRDFFRTGSFTEIKFKVQNAFLKFTATEGAEVELTASAEIFSTKENGTVKTVTLTGTGKEQYVAVSPKTTTITYAVNGEEIKTSQENALAVGKIYPLNFLGGIVSLNPGVWEVDGAWFAARFYETTTPASVNALTRAGEVDEAWVKMTDDNYDGVYECLVPGAYNKVIFCRMASTATEANFGTWDGVVWNQTADLTINNEKECYSVTGWSQEEGAWGDKPAAPTYGVAGSFQEWKPENAVNMEFVSDGWYVAKGIELYKDDAFKIVKNKSWDVSYGASGEVAIVITLDTPTTLVTNGKDMIPATNGKFDIYFSAKTHELKYTCVEEYTSLTVNITIDNQAKWNPVFITLKSGNTTIASKATVSNNTYAVSGAYIGEGLTYELTTSSNAAAVTGEVSITRNGATIVLPEQKAEEPVKNMLYLKPNSNWKQSNARFAAYFFGNGEKWVSMKAVSGKTGFYEVEIPAGWEGKSVIFCRMNPSASANNWNNKWNQTADLTIPTNGNNLYTVTENTWDKGGGTWSKFQ